jgi:hypothetical protein
MYEQRSAELYRVRKQLFTYDALFEGLSKGGEKREI